MQLHSAHSCCPLWKKIGCYDPTKPFPTHRPKKINNRFCGPTLTRTCTYTNTHGLTNHAAGRAAFIISSNFEGSIESSSGWVVQQAIAHQVQNVLARKSDLQNAEDSGVVDLWTWIYVFGTRSCSLWWVSKGLTLQPKTWKGMDEALEGKWREGDPPTWEVMKLTAFKCWKIALTSTSLREYWETSGWTFQKRLLEGFTPRTSGKWLFNWTISWERLKAKTDHARTYTVWFLEWMTLKWSHSNAIHYVVWCCNGWTKLPLALKLKECIPALPSLISSCFYELINIPLCKALNNI